MKPFRLCLLLPLLLQLPVHAQSECKYSELLTLPVAKMKTAAALSVSGQINGEAADMLLDTGAEKTFLVRREMEKRKVVMEGVPEMVRGVGGVQTVFAAKPREVGVGPILTRNKRFPVVDSLANLNVAAVLGSDFLLQTDMELNLREGSVKFFQAKGCADRGLSYWDPDAMSVPLVEMQKGGRPIVEVMLNGVKGRALIDTGASRSIVKKHFAEKAGFSADKAAPPVRMAGNGIGTEANDFWSADFDSFAVGSETIRKPQLQVISLPRHGDDTHDMILGLDFLWAHRLLISVSQERMYFSYLGGDVFSSLKRW
ncbi:aspartyl protease family protein [Massilia endophytica]|uniref:aspartyl protease family protein n=1 Tax=Massilia endophytica TaxID=2899220 RepID=UPI001E5353A7|nr:aspartyl protease family protein [Massilia endophytica]UGQ45910.1 aspartyl protease family protein [Massilia endophytica]